MRQLFSIAEGRYLLADAIGEGGMATVYRAFDLRLGVWRAVKVLAQNYSGKRKVLARFDSEARTMALLEHENIVRVYDVGKDENIAYIVMEMVVGGALVDWLESHGAMPERLAAQVTLQICDGISYAHGKGVIHRDIKPHNVLVTQDGICRVTDFGIARLADEDKNLTKTGAVMGTWGYMAPEQRSSAKSVDERSDVYAIAATMYTLLANTMPLDLFAADKDDEVMAGISERMRELLIKATQYKREHRHSSVEAFKQALLELIPHLEPLPDSTPKLARSSSLVIEAPKPEEQKRARSLNEMWRESAIPEGVASRTLMLPEPVAGILAPTMAPGEWKSTPVPTPRATPVAQIRGTAAPIPEPNASGGRPKNSPFVWMFAASPGLAGVCLMAVAAVIAIPRFGNTETIAKDPGEQPKPEVIVNVPEVPDKPVEQPVVLPDKSEDSSESRQRRRRRRRAEVSPPVVIEPTPPVVDPPVKPDAVAQCVQLVSDPGDLRVGETAAFRVKLCDPAAQPQVYLYYQAVGSGRGWQKRRMTRLGGVYSFAVQVESFFSEGMNYYVVTDGAMLGAKSNPKFLPTFH